MPTIVLVGTGNVAHHLFHAFGAQIIQVLGRNSGVLRQFSGQTDTTSSFERIKNADLYLLAISDDAISEVSRHLSNVNGLVAHTSGSVAMSQLQSERKGVFYPLQTFTKGRKLDFSKIPICLEAESDNDYELLEILAKSISKSVYRISSERRKTLHMAAIFANNFSNHLFQISKEICENDNLDFNLLKPLIEETVNKIEFMSPYEAQTGPAKRNNIQTMQRHLDGLRNSIHKKVYQIISESIQRTYEEKL